jgi:hypothetical protein
MGGRRFAVLAIAAGFAITSAAGLAALTERPASDVTQYVTELREAARMAEQAADSSGSVAAPCARFGPAAARLVSAADAARAVFDRYRTAKTRYGTREEIELIRSLALGLREALGNLARAAGEGSPPSAGEVDAAEREVGAFQVIVAGLVEDRLGIEGLADALTQRGFRGVAGTVTKELQQRIRVRAEAELRRLTGLRIRLDVPLKQQLRDFMEAELSRLLSKLVVSAGPAGLVISLVAGKILNPGRLVDMTLEALRKLLRPKGNVVARANTSLAGLEGLRRQLNALPPDAPLDQVRRILRNAQRELGRTAFLKSDLKREKQTELLGRLTQAETDLARTVSLSTRRFLLDSDLFGQDFRIAVAFAAKIRADTERLARKLGCEAALPPPLEGRAPTAAVCVPQTLRIEYFGSLGGKQGEYDARFQALMKDPNSEFGAKCLWVATGPTDEAFVAFLTWIPIGTPGSVPSGDCARNRPDFPPFYHSRKRQLSVSGGNRKMFQNAVGGNERILKGVLAAAEAAGVGRACPKR